MGHGGQNFDFSHPDEGYGTRSNFWPKSSSKHKIPMNFSKKKKGFRLGHAPDLGHCCWDMGQVTNFGHRHFPWDMGWLNRSKWYSTHKYSHEFTCYLRVLIWDLHSHSALGLPIPINPWIEFMQIWQVLMDSWMFNRFCTTTCHVVSL
jgi:hypothetical protein